MSLLSLNDEKLGEGIDTSVSSLFKASNKLKVSLFLLKSKLEDIELLRSRVSSKMETVVAEEVFASLLGGLASVESTDVKRFIFRLFSQFF